jgi:hypothetical protein
MKGLKYLQPTSIRSILVPAVLLLIAHTDSAQISAGTKPIYSIEFKPATNTTAVEGTVSPPRTVGPDMTNEGSEQYLLNARAGQHLVMEITSDNHQAVFTLILPSPAASKIEFVKNATGVNRWSGTLTVPGNYLITLFTRGETLSRFKLRITLR